MKIAPQGQEFVFCDGHVADSLGKLVEHIKEISPEEFSFHVNPEKNDFYSWVHDCLSREIAEDIKGNKSQKEMIEKLTGHHWHHEHKKKYKY